MGDERAEIVIPTLEQIEAEIERHKLKIRNLYTLKTAVKRMRQVPDYPLLEAAGIDGHRTPGPPEEAGTNTIGKLPVPAKDDGTAMAG